MPKQKSFFNLFKETSLYIKELAVLLSELAANFNNFEDYSRRAKDIEHKCDAKTHEIIDRLNKTFITPIDREDVYHLAHELDDIADLIEDVIHNFSVYGISSKVKAIDEFASLIVKASEYLEELISHLENHKYTAQLNELVVKIHVLEDQGDVIFSDSMQKLFQDYSDPVEIIKLKDILEGLENVIDKYQKVSDIIEGIIVKSS